MSASFNRFLLFVLESMSETEFSNYEAMELTNSESERQPVSDAEKPSPAKPTEAAAVTLGLHQEEQQDYESIMTKSSENDDDDYDDDNDDTQSNKSLDLNFATKLTDFKFSESDQPKAAMFSDCENPKSILPVDSNSQERTTQPEDNKLTCKSCNKCFRYPATLARHEKVHQQESVVVTPVAESSVEDGELRIEEIDEDHEKLEQKGAAECEGAGSVADSGSEEEKDEKDERSDEDEGTTEPKSGDGEPEISRGKSDRRKKLCGVCDKRFWSLQDLTRHMRSHTGKNCSKVYI